MAVDRDLTVAGLAQRAGVLAGDADGAAALLGKAGIVEDQDGVALGGEGEQALDASAIEVVLVPVDGRQEALEALFGGARDDLGQSVAILVGVLGQQPGEVAFEALGSLAAVEVDTKGSEELREPGQWSARCVWDPGSFIPFLRILPTKVQLTKQY